MIDHLQIHDLFSRGSELLSNILVRFNGLTNFDLQYYQTRCLEIEQVAFQCFKRCSVLDSNLSNNIALYQFTINFFKIILNELLTILNGH